MFPTEHTWFRMDSDAVLDVFLIEMMSGGSSQSVAALSLTFSSVVVIKHCVSHCRTERDSVCVLNSMSPSAWNIKASLPQQQ